MNVEIANALSGYIETLYILNKKLIKLCGLDVIASYECGEKEILDIIQEIPRIVPYSMKRDTKKLEYKNRDGLLEFSNEIKCLRSDYDALLENNYDFLYKIKQIRNKYEHKMHGIKFLSSGSGSLKLFDFTFQIDDDEVNVYAGEFIKLIKQLNTLFSKIINEISSYAWENGKYEYAYYKRITRFKFEDFNSLYDCELLNKIGRIMYEF